MKLGIVGLPQSGKTTIFNALTRGTQPTGTVTGKIEVHEAVVDVPDDRVDKLAEMFNPKKTIYAKVTYDDISGLDGSAKSGISGELLNKLAQMDGFIHVVRCFENENVVHPNGSIDPLRDIASMESDFILNDTISVERRLERLHDEKKKGGGRDKAVIDREIELFDRMHECLSEEKPLRSLGLSDDEKRSLSGFGMLSLKPILILLNLDETQDAPSIPDQGAETMVSAIRGKIEMEIAQLPEEDAEMFMEEYGITELALKQIIKLSYDLLDQQSFFTAGADECRAWTTSRHATAPEAAGVIHTDLQKGFIRAEVVAYDDLMELGSMNEAKAKGKLRLEGKEYLVKDGDILNIRFNVSK
ncbi:MAG: redox-regulated ATPase YchF [Anaerolineaceae bacterium]|nr:redox-regulated ATPase YchF [Anaerolineaceae bacterium]